MATQVSGYIGKINPGNGTSYAIGSTAYGYCQTAADTAAKVVDMTGFTLTTGATIFVKFQYANSVASPTLNVNGTGAKPMYRYGTTAMSTSTTTNGWAAGAVLPLTYDGTGWIEHFWNNTTYWTNSCYCDTAAATAAKVGTCSFYTLQKGYLQVAVRYDNTAKSALTLNINSKGAKPIYINGAASSTSNYTLPGGMYFVYYDGTNYYFRTDGKISGLLPSTISIGSATAGTAIAADDITAWNAGSVTTATVSNETLTITTGTKPSLSYTARSIPNISVASKTVVTGFTV